MMELLDLDRFGKGALLFGTSKIVSTEMDGFKGQKKSNEASR